MGLTEPPSADFTIEVHDHTALLRVDRDLDLSCAPDAQAAVDQVLETDVTSVCVDLDAVRFVDSSGVAVLLRLLEATRERGGRTVVIAGAPGVLRVFSLLGLEHELTVVPTRSDVPELPGT